MLNGSRWSGIIWADEKLVPKVRGFSYCYHNAFYYLAACNIEDCYVQSVPESFREVDMLKYTHN
jgi:hypothetical protein